MEKAKSNRKLGIKLVFFTACMGGFVFALVGLYGLICYFFGINGKTGDFTSASNYQVNIKRDINVQAITTNNNSIKWKFYPVEKKFMVHPGENRKVVFIANNTSDHAMTTRTVLSVSPGNAARYVNKVDCFCRKPQTLAAHEQAAWEFTFYVSPDIPKNIKTITLGMTLFEAK